MHVLQRYAIAPGRLRSAGNITDDSPVDEIPGARLLVGRPSVIADSGGAANPKGPGARFEVLFAEPLDDGISLPEAWQRVYGTDWRVPASESGPHVFVNFATSRDGRISFSEPGHAGGGDVTNFNPPDQWLMGLIRARADAVMIGDNTLRAETHWLGTPEFMFPHDGDAFRALRRHEKRSETALHIILSLSGDLPSEAAIFRDPNLHVIVATTSSGRDRARELASSRANVEVLDLGKDVVDPKRLIRMLYDDYGASSILCEGGSRVYGSLVAAGQVNEEFLTLCPIVIGSSPDRPARPSLIEGVAFSPGATPRTKLVSLRRVNDYLYLHSRYV
jgi:riboflavin biosynthesis pyrimidine reductase